MHADGYYGDVCVDSMILHNGDLAPLVEINARKSMGLIKHAIEQHLNRLGRKACLTYVAAVNGQATGFSTFIHLLERERLLFSMKCSNLGILPLTSSTMYPKPTSEMKEPVRGRLYVALVFEKPEQQAGLMAGLGRVMEQAGLHVTHSGLRREGSLDGSAGIA